MTPTPADDDREHSHGRLRFELILASAWLGVGLFLLPALIYAVGVMMLGPYDEEAGLGTFYVDFFRDLAEPSGRAWAITLGPLILTSLVRAIFIGVQPRSAERADVVEHKEPVRPAPPSARVEPRVGLD